MWDGKASIDLTYLTPLGLARYAEACGLTLARAHARSGYRISIASYLGETDEFDEAVADFSATYAGVNGEDHARVVTAIANGRLSATLDE